MTVITAAPCHQQHVTHDSHLQDDLFHFFIWSLKFTDQDDHELPGVVVGIHGIHEGNDEAYRFQESRKDLQGTLEQLEDMDLVTNNLLMLDKRPPPVQPRHENAYLSAKDPNLRPQRL